MFASRIRVASRVRFASRIKLLLGLAILVVTSATAVAQDRIQLAQGRRAFEDKVTFVIDVVHSKSEASRNATAPDDMQIFVGFEPACVRKGLRRWKGNRPF
jgi:hypothetical protein